MIQIRNTANDGFGSGMNESADKFKQCCSVADPYHFYTDPDPGCEQICYGSGSRTNFDTDLDPGKNDTDTDLDPGKKGISTRKILKM